MTQKSKGVEYVISVERENQRIYLLLVLVSQTPSWIPQPASYVEYGCLVVLIKNLNRSRGLCNGILWIITVLFNS